MASVSVISLWFLVIVALSFSKRREFGDRRISLFRALFPSWRFFDQLDDVLRLEVRVSHKVKLSVQAESDLNELAFTTTDDEAEWSDWLRLPPVKTRGIHSLIYNPIGNVHFAIHSLVDQTARDINSSGDDENFCESVSYQLLTRAVRSLAQDFVMTNELGGRFQFRIQVIEAASGRVRDSILVSGLHDLNSDGFKSSDGRRWQVDGRGMA